MYGNVVDSSSNNIPTAFAVNNVGSNILVNAPSSGTIVFISYLADTLAWVSGFFKNQAPSSTLPGKTGFIPAAPTGGSGFATMEVKVTKGDSVFIRATGGSPIASGKLFWHLI